MDSKSSRNKVQGSPGVWFIPKPSIFQNIVPENKLSCNNNALSKVYVTIYPSSTFSTSLIGTDDTTFLFNLAECKSRICWAWENRILPAQRNMNNRFFIAFTILIRVALFLSLCRLYSSLLQLYLSQNHQAMKTHSYLFCQNHSLSINLLSVNNERINIHT